MGVFRFNCEERAQSCSEHITEHTSSLAPAIGETKPENPHFSPIPPSPAGHTNPLNVLNPHLLGRKVPISFLSSQWASH